MNSTARQDNLNSAFTQNFITFALGFIINSINGAFVFTFFKNQVFQRDPRYVLYIHLVINDMIMLTISVALQMMTYTVHLHFTHCCLMLLILMTTNKISPLNIAGMAVERYIAVCRPLRHVHICTVQKAYALIALLWGTSTIPYLTDIIILLATRPLSVFSSTVICYPTFLYNTPYHKTHSIIMQILLFSFVFLTLIVTYLKVARAARAVSGSNRDSARNARNTILLHGVHLLLCLMSFISPLLNFILITRWPRDRTKILTSSFLLINMLPRLLSSVIYGIRDKKLRSHIRLLFCYRSKERR